MASGWYILGPELRQFETSLAAFWRLPHAAGVAIVPSSFLARDPVPPVDCSAGESFLEHPSSDGPFALKNALKGLRPDQFSCPGSILKVFVDNRTPVGFGMADTASAVFYNNIAFDAAPAMSDSKVHVIARYPSSGILESGWIGGEEYLNDKIAAAEVEYGKGRVILIGFAAQNRAQPHGTFKLLFNALHYSGAEDQK